MLEVSVRGSRGNFAYEYVFGVTEGITAVWGKSGAGKTTLLKVIAGLEKPKTGSIRFGEQRWLDSGTRTFRDPRRRHCGYVPQSGILFPHLTVKKNLTYSNRISSRKADVALETMTALLDLDQLLDRYPDSLSGGEARRVALGRAMMSNPSVLLLDEPFSGLDDQRIVDISKHILTLNRKFSVPVLLVTHSLREVARIADLMIVVSDGRVLDAGPVEDLLPRIGTDPETGSSSVLISGKIEGYDEVYGLNQLNVEGQTLLLPGGKLDTGVRLRILIKASEVLIAADAKAKTSARNHLNCTIQRVEELPDNRVQLWLGVGTQQIVSEITRFALDELGLSMGKQCVAILKSVSLSNHVFQRDSA